jgi:hypothetical protein
LLLNWLDLILSRISLRSSVVSKAATFKADRRSPLERFQERKPAGQEGGGKRQKPSCYQGEKKPRKSVRTAIVVIVNVF